MDTLKHCTIENLGKRNLEFWWELKNDARLQRYYWGNPWEVFSKRVLEREIEKSLKSKELRRVTNFIVKDLSGDPIACLVFRRNLWLNAPTPCYSFVSIVPISDGMLEGAALNEAFKWLLEMCFLNHRVDVVCVEPLEDNVPYIRFLEKCGFQRQGLLRNCFMAEGRFLGRVLMDLLEKEWQSATSK